MEWCLPILVGHGMNVGTGREYEFGALQNPPERGERTEQRAERAEQAERSEAPESAKATNESICPDQKCDVRPHE